MNNKLMGALSLAKKAGALRTGFDAVRESVAKGEAVLVLLAQDASAGTRRRMETACAGKCEAWTLPLAQADIAAITRKLVAVMAVTDENMKKLIAAAIAK